MHNPLSPEIRRQLYAHRKSFTRDQERPLCRILPRYPQETRLLCETLYLT